ncbi:MAG: fibronectin type III domain-containing protein, partial [Methanomassiliicoccales archaeon]|nr:fibronectin type III domain-containing protein [Methanomassiliicoccales archaeon]
AIEGDSMVALSWNEVNYSGPGALVYHLYRDGNLIWNGSATASVDSPLTKGVQYSYCVSASNDIGFGPNSSAVLATPFGVPDAPWGLIATSGDGRISLGWDSVNYSGPGIVVYHLFRNGVLIWNGSLLLLEDVGLTNGISYEYCVSASNSVGWSANSSSASTSPEGPPTSPVGLRAEAGDGFVLLYWSVPQYAGPGTLTYHLYRNDTLIWSGEGLEHNDTMVMDLIEYSYQLAAENAIGQGPNSSAVHATPMPKEMTPTVPRDLNATAGVGNVTLRWDAPSHSNASAVIGYNVSYGDSPLSFSNNLTTDGLSCVIGGLQKGREYWFAVSARNAAGEGPASEAISAIPYGKPDAPTGLNLVAGNERIGMNWTAPPYSGPGTLTYHVFRDGALIWSGGSLVYQDLGLMKGRSYSYEVSANNSVGRGPNSTSATATPFGVPSVPRGLNATPSDLGLTLNWSLPTYVGPGTFTYHLYRDGLALWNGTATSFLDAGAIDHQWHNYTVVASNSVGHGDNATAIQAKLDAVVINPADYTAIFAVAGAASVLAVLMGALMAWSARRKS